MRTQWVRLCAVGASIAVIAVMFAAPSARAASQFANPAFATTWRTGELVTTNFWGPLATARDGQSEPYAGGVYRSQTDANRPVDADFRLVQYFDKGRMEITDANSGTVTSGLLATELIRGQIQTGPTRFEPKTPPAISVAGDPNGGGPTYADIGRAAPLQRETTANANAAAVYTVSDGGAVSTAPQGEAMMPAPDLVAADFDSATRHNVPRVFAAYRARVGLAVIGQAITEPFGASVRVGGVRKVVTMQVFERRSLTYTEVNPDPFKVEMGNVGRHYYQWRYGGGTTPPPTLPVAPPTASPPSAGTVVRTISDADSGQTITLRPGERVQLLLSTRWNWEIATSDPAVFALVPDAPVILLSQGIYEARMPGQATLTGTGRPAGCVTGQVCIQIVAELRVEIVVQ